MRLPCRQGKGDAPGVGVNSGQLADPVSLWVIPIVRPARFGAHSQGATPDELERNLREVIAMLLEDGEPKLESEFVGLQTIQVE